MLTKMGLSNMIYDYLHPVCHQFPVLYMYFELGVIAMEVWKELLLRLCWHPATGYHLVFRYFSALWSSSFNFCSSSTSPSPLSPCSPSTWDCTLLLWFQKEWQTDLLFPIEQRRTLLRVTFLSYTVKQDYETVVNVYVGCPMTSAVDELQDRQPNYYPCWAVPLWI